MAIKNPTVEVIEEYINAKTKIKHHCLVHDVYWDALPTNILKGKGCPECKYERISSSLTMTHDEYVERVSKEFPNITVIGRFVGVCTKILHRCEVHNVEWSVLPSNILSGQGCPKCRYDKIRAKKTKTHEEYVEELSIKNPYVEVVEMYAGANTKIKHHCLEHDIYWDITPSGALAGHGCPQCHKERTGRANAKSHDDFVAMAKEISPHISIIGEYKGSHLPLLCFCEKHNIEWTAFPSNILRGCGCPECGKEKISEKNTLTQDEYETKVKEVNSNIEVIGKYINAKTPLRHRCLIHDFEWDTTSSPILSGCGCPKCRSEKISGKLLKTNEEYLSEVASMNPSIVPLEPYINASTPILHKCLDHDMIWKISPTNILLGYGCPKCSGSRGERVIMEWLERREIEYEYQKSFNDCRDVKVLPFDFYLPKYNLIIEYDGVQHFEPNDFFGGQEGFEYTVRHDEMKNNYCKENNIEILRIPYYKDINEELNNFIN